MASGDTHGPVGPLELAELTGAVERVDDPQAPAARHVFEALLGPYVVLGVQAVQLADQDREGQPIPGGTQVPSGGRTVAQIEQYLARLRRQRGRVLVLSR